jgi:hypothetical protein
MANTTNNTDELSEVINNIAQRKNVVSEEALKAKVDYDQLKQDLHPLEFSRKTRKHLGQLDDFNENVKLLMAVFHESRFDELMVLLANPGRMFTINLLVGFVRGMGIALGFMLMVFLLLYLMKESLSPDILKNLGIIFNALKQ